MGPRSLPALHQLQVIETHLRSLKGKLARKRRLLGQHDLKIKQLDEQLVARKEEIKHRQSATNQLELEFKAREAAINKLRTQLNTAKNNKEYSAILTQLNTERAGNSKLEERILQELTGIDEMKTSLGEMADQIDKDRQGFAELEAQFKREEDELRSQITELEQQRAEGAQGVAPEDLAVFQRVADSHDGEATAAILKPHPKQEEYICAGCNMTIPAETVNALMTRDELKQCHICGRILYLEDNESTKE